MRILSLFHGQLRPNDGIEFYAGRFGVEVDSFDTEISSSHDLADDALWSQIAEKIDDSVYAAGVGGSPCSTFSFARSLTD